MSLLQQIFFCLCDKLLLRSLVHILTLSRLFLRVAFFSIVYLLYMAHLSSGKLMNDIRICLLWYFGVGRTCGQLCGGFQQWDELNRILKALCLFLVCACVCVCV